MRNTTGINKSRATSTVATNVTTEIGRTGILAISVVAGSIGCWAVAGMIAGVINSGGAIKFATSLFMAING